MVTLANPVVQLQIHGIHTANELFLQGFFDIITFAPKSLRFLMRMNNFTKSSSGSTCWDDWLYCWQRRTNKWGSWCKDGIHLWCDDKANIAIGASS
jgi:hypothetical protein